MNPPAAQQMSETIPYHASDEGCSCDCDCCFSILKCLCCSS
ncbi:hypothetical protein ACP70R_026590 [Stipagrostis hirtigluma subsp. patula]